MREDKTNRWDWTSWLWVFLCAAGIFATIPLARSVQEFITDTVGREFFMYLVFFVVLSVLATLLYFFIFKLQVKKTSQYIWLFICAGLYLYFTIQLRTYPEEAIHLIEYGLLSWFVFNALAHRIRDWTIYITTILFVLFFGTADEFIQWMMPNRYWGLNDVWINLLAGLIFILGMRTAIVPDKICRQVEIKSVRVLAGMMTINLIFLGLCLSNTPDSVKRYTAAFSGLSWLRSEEPMTEYGFEHKAPEIGNFSSRLTLEEIKRIDAAGGNLYENKLPEDTSPELVLQESMKTYNPYTNKFMYEFLIHVSRRDDEFQGFKKTASMESKLKAFKENQIAEKYFGSTLNKTNSNWPVENIEALGDTASLEKEDYSSRAGEIITSFNLKELWLFIAAAIVVVRISAGIWKRKLSAG
ncbi:MAG: VanZ family protein [Nitrospirae bacterium]|nr:VanZ family protein [Nitrospirota bacterium]